MPTVYSSCDEQVLGGEAEIVSLWYGERCGRALRRNLDLIFVNWDLMHIALGHQVKNNLNFT